MSIRCFQDHSTQFILYSFYGLSFILEHDMLYFEIIFMMRSYTYTPSQEASKIWLTLSSTISLCLSTCFAQSVDDGRDSPLQPIGCIFCFDHTISSRQDCCPNVPVAWCCIPSFKGFNCQVFQYTFRENSEVFKGRRGRQSASMCLNIIWIFTFRYWQV